MREARVRQRRKELPPGLESNPDRIADELAAEKEQRVWNSTLKKAEGH